MKFAIKSQEIFNIIRQQISHLNVENIFYNNNIALINGNKYD